MAGLLFLTLFTYYASGSQQPGNENPDSPQTPFPWEEEDSRKGDDNSEVTPEGRAVYGHR